MHPRDFSYHRGRKRPMLNREEPLASVHKPHVGKHTRAFFFTFYHHKLLLWKRGFFIYNNCFARNKYVEYNIYGILTMFYYYF